MIEDGTVAHIVATISPANNREQRERRIVDQLTALLRNTPDESRGMLFNEHIGELVDEARRSLNLLGENDVILLTVEVGHSIGLFYFATSVRGLQYLNEVYSNEQLKSMMQKLFIALLKTDDAVPDLLVDTLRWDLSNYTYCLQQLYSYMDLPILSHVYAMVKRNQEHVSMCDDVRSLSIDQLPFELIEILLIQTTGHLFVTMYRRTPRAVVYTMATMMAVSHLWWEALSSRRYIKRFLKRSFKCVCHPYECSPQAT